MTKIEQVRKLHYEQLERASVKHGLQFSSVLRLLEAEKTKKLFKRNALIQQTIDREIDKSLNHEN